MVAGFGVDVGEVIRGLGAKGIFVKALYPGVRDQKELGRLVARDLVFTMPVRWAADRHSKLAQTWRYYFDYTAAHERVKDPHGVPHGAEIVYFLDNLRTLPGPYSESDREYARKVSEYVFEFARVGTPASPRAPGWPDHNTRDETMVFGKAMVPQNNFMKARLNVMIGAIKLLGPMFARK